MRRVIGMAGKAGAGKDTVAAIIQGKLERDRIVQLSSLAEPIKKAIHVIFTPRSKWYEYLSREERDEDLAYHGWPGWTRRMLWQTFGTEVMRGNYGDDLWVKVLLNRVKHVPWDVLIVTDCRFPNEANILRDGEDYDFTLVKVERDAVESVGVEGHASEAHDLLADWHIDNNGTVDELGPQVDELIEHLGL